MLAALTREPARLGTATGAPVVRTFWMGGAVVPEGPVVPLATGVAVMLAQPVGGMLPGEGPWWHVLAACRGIPRAVFFGDESAENPAHRRAPRGQAKRVCRGCPVRRACLGWALTKPEEYGVWGGTDGEERKRLRRELAGGAGLTGVLDRTLHGA